MAWHSFVLRPERVRDVPVIDQFRALYDSVQDWVATNKTKTVKIALLSGRTSGAHTWEQFELSAYHSRVIRIKFRSKRDATLFKLFFSNDILRDDTWVAYSVILPLIKRAMPSIIAAEICGVSPMTGPSSSFFAMRQRYIDQSKPLSPSQTKQKKTSMAQLLENTRRALDGLV